jgi:hypothetical protein
MGKLHRTLIAGATVVALATGGAYAQSVVQDNLSGNETWQAGQGPGGPGAFITSNQLRNGAAKVVAAATGAVTLGSGAYAALRSGGLVVITTQPLATTTLTLPPNPVPDGARIGFCNGTDANFATTAISFTTSTGQTLAQSVSATSLGKGLCIQVMFNRATTTWYRIQ